MRRSHIPLSLNHYVLQIIGINGSLSTPAYLLFLAVLVLTIMALVKRATYIWPANLLVDSCDLLILKHPTLF